MDYKFLIKGIISGFLIAAPLGPIGVLCIRRTLKNGIMSGLLTGLGAALADSFYGLVGVMGLTVISIFLIKQKMILGLIGGAFLIYLGIKIIMTKNKDIKEENKFEKAGDLLSAFFLTITNPITILLFAALFAGGNLIDVNYSFSTAVNILGGIFIGSMLWWIILTMISNFFRTKLNVKILGNVNLIAGIIIIVFGIMTLIKL